ncbi:MAG: dinitrogenase iron-molybdenum cofactor biosynthesis protein [Oscillospiraceae bacterium]|nr:dinitrogenase iron-molybdenum cofactor biosynthesis protein [Oscillospiraceae bacterium]
MTYRLAIASSDGKVVNQHFGHADQFHIVDLDTENNTCNYVDTRKSERVCEGQFHQESSFDRVADVLKDVQAILVAKIGDGASSQMESRGFTVYESPFLIEPLIEKILKDRLWEVDAWRSPTKS